MFLRRPLARLGLLLLALVVADQVALVTLLGDDAFLGRPVAPFDPPIFNAAQAEALEHIEAFLTGTEGSPRFAFDAELGWCPRPRSGGGEFAYDWAGARIGSAPLPRDKGPGVRRVAVLGCSMTHGDEVGARETWCARLDDELPGVEVANLGVSAYGLDQALLRLRRDAPAVEPDEVWLGLLPEAALRVTTLYRPALRHWSSEVCFKPRFTLAPGSADGRLELVANPARTLADVVALVRSPQRFLGALERDPWVRRVPAAYAARGSRLSHRSFAARLVLTLREAVGRDHAAALEDPRSETFRLLAAIVRAAAEESAGLGARFRLLILPGRTDLGGKRRYWSGWCAPLAEDGIEVVDLSTALFEQGQAGHGVFQVGGHYTPEASARVALELAALLRTGGR